MESLLLHLPKIQSKKTIKFSELFNDTNPLPDAYKKYQREGCTIITTTKELYPFSLKHTHIDADLLSLVSHAGYTLYPPDISVIESAPKVISALRDNFKDMLRIYNYALPFYDSSLYCKEDPLKDITFDIYNGDIQDIYFTNTGNSIFKADLSILDGHSFSFKKEKAKTGIALIPKYQDLYNKLYKSQFTGVINFTPASIVGPHITFSYYIPNTLGYEKNMNFYHAIFESIKEIDLKDPNYSKVANIAKPLSINKRLNALYNYFLTTDAKKKIDDLLGEDPVLDSSNKHCDKYTCFNSVNTSVNPHPVALSYIKQASFVDDNKLSIILDNSFIFEKYISSIANFISTDNPIHTSIINLLIYGTYIHNINTKAHNDTFKRTYNVRMKLTKDTMFYFSSCNITLKNKFKQDLLSNTNLFNIKTSFFPMFYTIPANSSGPKEKNFILKHMEA